MQNISIDLGSYSVKFLHFSFEKGKAVFTSSKEVVLDTDQFDVTSKQILLDLQLKIVQEYITELDDEFRIVMNSPSDFSTTRFLSLPVKNKKKAQLMIPFQLEEDVPYSLSTSHLSYQVEVKGSETRAIVDISNEEDFKEFYYSLSEAQVKPSLLIPNASIFDYYIKNTKTLYPQSFCILDFGHKKTRGYFYFNSELTSIHTSYIAGETINEVISQSYNINIDEAYLYKHQNCFFLTDDQYQDVNDNQRVFARLMEKTLNPLIQEFKRWEVGSRVQNGVGISEVFITGGSSNIKNIKAYLQQELSLKINYLNTIGEDANIDKIDSDQNVQRKFNIASLQAKASKEKSKIINTLHSRFSFKGSSDFPLKTLSFVSTRVAILCLILFSSFFIERMFIKKQINAVTKSIEAVKKNKILGLTARQKRLISSQPANVVSALNRKVKDIDQTVTLFQSSANINSFNILLTLSQTVKDLDVELIKYQALSKGDFNGLFKAQNTKDLETLEQILNSTNIPNLFLEKDATNLTLNISGGDIQ